MAWFTISAAFFRFLQSGLDERHLAAILLENDKIVQIIASVASAILTALSATSCAGYGPIAL